ncbi:hypothetical protein Tco_0705591 [Tanacetum coccineum]|uniref:Uncharacterized protein n=1 Tax=Tanacetum coccineum TaxID=301880 RepID=A0ABQ4Y509_9ASTR
MTDGELCLSSTCIFNIICSLLILSPYFFKFISFFISPLHFSLLLLSIIATSLYHQKTIVDKLRPKVVEEDDEEFLDFEIVFHDHHHHPSLINSNGNASIKLEEHALSSMENPGKSWEKIFKEEWDRFEDSLQCRNYQREIFSFPTKLYKLTLGKPSAMSNNNQQIQTPQIADNLKTNEKEWKRMLACKLFEKRCSLEGGGEGMDSLWEAFEEDDNTNKISRMRMVMRWVSGPIVLFDGIEDVLQEDEYGQGEANLVMILCWEVCDSNTGSVVATENTGSDVVGMEKVDSDGDGTLNGGDGYGEVIVIDLGGGLPVYKTTSSNNWCMTRSSTKELLTPFENLERVLRSRRMLFDTPSFVESNSPKFDQLSEIEEHIEEEVLEIMTETMEQYMSKTSGEYGSGVARPNRVMNKAQFELRGIFLKSLRDNTI